ncbi:PorP/SprF family type IX secretion system membrane protein [Rubrolithibacter danxiaensis]|uniref:PorP/SprF family type IX secretion system membrane protein n=1 Tax=Rubrolithibacter danxiaensis TaxID=3390805 RepID=UPI003BF8898B
MNTCGINKSIIKLLLPIFLLLFIKQESRAQLNPLGGIYFQNQYQANPAMAGLEDRLNLNLSMRQQWNSIPGAPKTQSITADYGFSNKVGLGLNIYNDQAGLQKQTRIMGTYAYHLPVGSDSQQLSFGVSFGFMNDRLNTEDMKGDTSPDVIVGRYNQRETFFDGDFGIAYTGKRLTIQGALPNMKSIFSKDQNNSVADRSIFYSAISYKIVNEESLNGFIVEPKICYRGVKGYDNIADIGTYLGFAGNALNLMAMYHTTQSATFGAGINYKKTLAIMGMYNTETAALSGYTNGTFEINLRVSLF